MVGSCLHPWVGFAIRGDDPNPAAGRRRSPQPGRLRYAIGRGVSYPSRHFQVVNAGGCGIFRACDVQEDCCPG